MMRLVLVELRRFFSRRLTKFACLGVLVILAFTLFGVQQQALESVPSRVQERIQQQVQQCEAAQAQQRQQDAGADFRCAEIATHMQQERVSFVGVTRDLTQTLAVLFAFVGFLIGATFLAAEFASGAIGNWLTFEPRRTRVYFSKLAGAALGSVPITIACLGILTAGVAFFTNRYGVAGTMAAGERNELLWLAVRIVVITAAATVGGAVLGALLRNTAAALGVTVGYVILVEAIFPSLIQRFLSDPTPWLVRGNFQAWVSHGLTYFLNSCSGTPGPEMACERVKHTVSFAHGSIYLGVLMVAFTALGAWVFSRRDVN